MLVLLVSFLARLVGFFSCSSCCQLCIHYSPQASCLERDTLGGVECVEGDGAGGVSGSGAGGAGVCEEDREVAELSAQLKGVVEEIKGLRRSLPPSHDNHLAPPPPVASRC